MVDCLRNGTIRICLIGYLGAATRPASALTDGYNGTLKPKCGYTNFRSPDKIHGPLPVSPFYLQSGGGPKAKDDWQQYHRTYS
jgi:hypothetical protein